MPTITDIMRVWIRDDPQAAQPQKVPHLFSHSPWICPRKRPSPQPWGAPCPFKGWAEALPAPDEAPGVRANGN